MKLIVLLFCMVFILCSCSEAAPAATTTTEASMESIDVDLTSMSRTVVYGKVYDILTNPSSYIGQTVKLSGPYNPSFFEGTQKTYHFVLIEDAAACCAQGMEFIWEGDYPDKDVPIEVIGVLGQYEEFGEVYTYLNVSDMTLL